MVNDFVTPRKKLSDKAVFRLGRIAWAPVILNFDTLIEYFQSFLGYLTMPVVVAIGAGLFWRRGTATACFWTLVTLVPIGFVGFLTGEVLGLPPVPVRHRDHAGPQPRRLRHHLAAHPGTPEQDDIMDVTFDKENWRAESRELKEKPWYANHRIIGVALVVLTLAVIIPFI